MIFRFQTPPAVPALQARWLFCFVFSRGLQSAMAETHDQALLVVGLVLLGTTGSWLGFCAVRGSFPGALPFGAFAFSPRDRVSRVLITFLVMW